ncbi:MAG TPA: hypothetical protein VGO62_02835 [Myxococcota bacterium]|jgi:hypothetical protein
MAEQNFLQRGLSGFRDTVRELRTGDGKGGAAQVGKGVKNAVGKAKAGLGKLKKTLGFSSTDAFDPDDQDEHRRRKRARELLGDDEPTFTGTGQRDPHRDLSTVAPEFRAQVSSGLAAANSMTTGSTLVDGGKKDGGERW